MPEITIGARERGGQPGPPESVRRRRATEMGSDRTIKLPQRLISIGKQTFLSLISFSTELRRTALGRVCVNGACPKNQNRPRVHRCDYNVTKPGKWQAAECPVRTSVNGGSISRQIFSAYGQRE